VTVVVMGTLAAAALAATIGRPRRLTSLVRRASIVFGLATAAERGPP
jgi:hypothetical protein